jgi:hypothetical protein
MMELTLFGSSILGPLALADGDRGMGRHALAEAEAIIAAGVCRSQSAAILSLGPTVAALRSPLRRVLRAPESLRVRALQDRFDKKSIFDFEIIQKRPTTRMISGFN